MSEIVLGIIIGFIGTWIFCALLVLGWVIASTIATRRQRRRGRAGW